MGSQYKNFQGLHHDCDRLMLTSGEPVLVICYFFLIALTLWHLQLWNFPLLMEGTIMVCLVSGKQV